MLQYFKDYSNVVEEALTDGGQNYINKAFIAGPPIQMADGRLVNRKEIVNLVSNAILDIANDFPSISSFAEDFTIVYVLNTPKCPTMLVNSKMELVINASFIYDGLYGDPKLVRGVLMHEILHVFYDHIQRGMNYDVAHGLDPYSGKVMHDNNLAADAEVNKSLMILRILSESDLNKIRAVYLKNDTKSGSGEKVYNNLSMEMILDDNELMNHLRSKCPFDDDPTKGKNSDDEKTIETTEEWDAGKKDCWNKCAKLIKKYGPQGFLDKLRSEGILDGMYDRITNKPDDLLSLSFINIKTFGEFINENLSMPGEWTTYEDGFWKCLDNIVRNIQGSLDGNSDHDGSDGPDGPKIKSKLKKDELDPIKLPGKKSKSKSKSDNDDNDNYEIDPIDDFDPDDDELINDIKNNIQNRKDKSGDKNKLVDEITTGGKSSSKSDSGNEKSDEKSGETHGGKSSSKSDSGNEKSGGESGETHGGKSSSQLGTGEFSPEDANSIEDMLKESGYAPDQIETIGKTIKNNRIINTPEAIADKRAAVLDRLKDGDELKKAFEAGLEASKEYKDLWQKVLKKFMNRNTEYAGVAVPGENIRWGEKRRLSIGMISPEVLKTAKEPQYINIYPDVSGSMNMQLLRALSEAIYSYFLQFKYSGITITPWATSSIGTHEVQSLQKRPNKNDVVAEIIACIESGSNACGGGTDFKGAGVPQMAEINKQNKKNVHVIITDGEFDNSNLERYISSATGNNKINKRCIWFIYDASADLKEEWKKTIKEGTLVFLNSRLFK